MAIVGEGAINGAKSLLGPRIDIIGMSVDLTANHSIGLSSTIYLKLVCAMFVMLDMDVAVGTRVSIKTLQSVASRALRSADVVHVMAAYSRGFSDNLRGAPKGAVEVELTKRAFEDLQMWRVTLELGFRDRRWLRVPIRVPLLHRYLPCEDAVQRAHRQAGLADLVVFADACTSHGHGMGYYCPGAGWHSTSLPGLSLYDVGGLSGMLISTSWSSSLASWRSAPSCQRSSNGRRVAPRGHILTCTCGLIIPHVWLGC